MYHLRSGETFVHVGGRGVGERGDNKMLPGTP